MWGLHVQVALLVVALALAARPTAAQGGSTRAPPPLLVVGSTNYDLTVQLSRLPLRGETKAALSPSPSIAVGGKGANQAVAAARLAAANGAPPVFVTRFGADGHGDWLRQELQAAGVNLSASATIAGTTSGTGIVWLDSEGAATSVVVGGANTYGWEGNGQLASIASQLVDGASALLLQREVPERVNEAFAEAAARARVPVLLDAGGSQDSLSPDLLALVDYICPNELELAALTGMPTDTDEHALAAARALYAAGARNVLATLGARGALLLLADNSSSGFSEGRCGDDTPTAMWQRALPVPGGAVLDATAAGDAFRAAFAVALAEGQALAQCLELGAAAGAIAASRPGAMPSLPTRRECDALLASPAVTSLPPEPARPQLEPGRCEEDGSGQPADADDPAGSPGAADSAGAPGAAAPAAASLATPAGKLAGAGLPAQADCPLLFASRLNSLAHASGAASASSGGGNGDGAPLPHVLAWVGAQGGVEGLDLVYFNYPQHLHDLAAPQVLAALDKAGLRAGGVAMRFPELYKAGALSNPDDQTRQMAVALAMQGCVWARELQAPNLVVWSAFDGYDYHLQADYTKAWDRLLTSFRQLADACPDVQVSLEWKPTDASSRFSFVPSTAAALQLVTQAGRDNLGLTLDTGHLLMAGENAAQAIALAAAAGKLFGLHLNDGHARLGAEDGLAFGSVHGTAALEVVVWLQRVNYTGHVYFDTFPLNEDPLREAAYNVRRFRALWRQAAQLQAGGLDDLLARQDALGVLELLEAAT